MQTKNETAIIQAKCDEVFLIAQMSHSSLRTQANISFWKLSTVTFEMSLMGDMALNNYKLFSIHPPIQQHTGTE